MYTIILFVFIVLTLVLWIWAIVDILKSIFSIPVQKTYWLLVVILFPILGSLLYFQLGRSSLLRDTRQFNPRFHNEVE